MVRRNQNLDLLNVSSRGHTQGAAPAIAAPPPDDVKVSFEFFPPAADDAKAQFSDTLHKLEILKPEFVSVSITRVLIDRYRRRGHRR